MGLVANVTFSEWLNNLFVYLPENPNNKTMGVCISKAFLEGLIFAGGGCFFVSGGSMGVGLILGVKNKLRNAWAYRRGKNSC